MFATASELKHFRQLLVNLVMATDLFDKELNALRQARWQRCFRPEDFPFPDEDGTSAFNRKATIVLEHIIQASDVAHTMQHWHVYLKWNERLFFEMYRAYKEGRSTKNPIDNWYSGESLEANSLLHTACAHIEALFFFPR
jgi:3'5'-cyclic nucleotide phosphodiesterase